MGEEVYKKVHSMENGTLEIDISELRLNKGINYLKVSNRYESRTMRIVRE